MVLLFLTPIKNDAPIYFNLVPSRAVIYFFLFWGFTHIWIGVLKKQFKYNHLKKKAFSIVMGVAFGICIFTQVLLFTFGNTGLFNYWSLILGVFGALTGLITFRLLYRSSY